MRLRKLPLVIAVAALPLMPSDALAGGWWSSIHLEGRYLGIGESVTFRSEVMFRNLEVAKRARQSGDFHAYLARGVDYSSLNKAMSVPEPKGWWSPPRELTLIGDVRLSNWDANLAIATTELHVPEVPPGSYALMLCNVGCATPLGNLIPLPIQVSSDALAARTARKLQSTNARLDLALARVRSDLRRQARQLNGARADFEQSTEAIARLQDRVASLEGETPSTSWLPNLLIFIAGAAATLLVLRFRGRRSSGPPEDPITPVPDDARELVSAQ
jgi:hypothetical protein